MIYSSNDQSSKPLTYEITRTEFWALLSESDRQFLRELADRKHGCGPLEFVRAWRNEEDG